MFRPNIDNRVPYPFILFNRVVMQVKYFKELGCYVQNMLHMHRIDFFNIFYAANLIITLYNHNNFSQTFERFLLLTVINT